MKFFTHLHKKAINPGSLVSDNILLLTGRSKLREFQIRRRQSEGIKRKCAQMIFEGPQPAQPVLPVTIAAFYIYINKVPEKKPIYLNRSPQEKIFRWWNILFFPLRKSISRENAGVTHKLGNHMEKRQTWIKITSLVEEERSWARPTARSG